MKEELLEPQGNIWLPETEGEKVRGKLLEVREGLYGSQYVMEKEDGTKITLPSHRYLLPRLAMAKMGDFLEIKFTGKEPPKLKGQNPMMLYEVRKFSQE